MFRRDHQPRFSAVAILVARGVHHRFGDHAQQVDCILRVRIHVQRAFSANHRHRALIAGKPALHVQRLPRALGLVFRAAKRIFSRLAVGRAVHFAGQRTAHVTQHETQSAAQRRVRPRAFAQAVECRIHAKLFRQRAVNDDPHRDRIGRCLYALQIKLRIGDRLDRRDQRRHVFRIASRQHGVDCDPFHRRGTEAGRDQPDHVSGRAPRMTQHALDALDRGRHDRQAVAPAPLTVEFVDGVKIIDALDERGTLRSLRPGAAHFAAPSRISRATSDTHCSAMARTSLRVRMPKGC